MPTVKHWIIEPFQNVNIQYMKSILLKIHAAEHEKIENLEFETFQTLNKWTRNTELRQHTWCWVRAGSTLTVLSLGVISSCICASSSIGQDVYDMWKLKVEKLKNIKAQHWELKSYTRETVPNVINWILEQFRNVHV